MLEKLDPVSVYNQLVAHEAHMQVLKRVVQGLLGKNHVCYELLFSIACVSM
jgi:hypothetical protein